MQELFEIIIFYFWLFWTLKKNQKLDKKKYYTLLHFLHSSTPSWRGSVEKLKKCDGVRIFWNFFSRYFFGFFRLSACNKYIFSIQFLHWVQELVLKMENAIHWVVWYNISRGARPSIKWSRNASPCFWSTIIYTISWYDYYKFWMIQKRLHISSIASSQQ